MTNQQRLIALSQQALDAGKIKNQWEHDFLISLISLSRNLKLSIKQKNRMYKILKDNDCYKDFL